MASAISSLELVPCAGTAQFGSAKIDLPDSFKSLADEVIWNIFKFLALDDLESSSRVDSQFRRCASDKSLWKESELRFRFPLLKNIFDKQAWGRIINLEALEGVSFEGVKPFNPASAFKALKDIHHLQVEGNAGYTIITMPQGMTINKLKNIIASFAAEGKFPADDRQQIPGFIFFDPRILKEFGDVPVNESYTFAISNSILSGSRNKSCDVQRALVRAEGCELPQLLEAMTLLFLTYMASGESHERLCGNDPRTHMRCLERMNHYPLAIGSFAHNGLFVNDVFDHTHYGAGASRKFLF